MEQYTIDFGSRSHHIDSHYAWQIRSSRDVSLLIAIVMLAFGTRIAVAVVTASWVFPSDGNFWKYGYEMGQIAASLAMGNGFSWPEWSTYPQGPTAWMPPVYPFIMAAAFKAFGIYSQQAAVALQLFQTIVSALTCVLLYILAKHLYDVHVGFLAAFLLAIYPPAIYYSVRYIWGTSLFAFCLLLLILVFLRQAEHPSVKQAVWLGSIMGFTTLVDPIIVSTYPFGLAWLYLKANGDRRTIAKTITAVIIVFCLSVTPWLVRNYIVFERFVFIKSNLGHELFLGNNEYATGSYTDAFSRFRENPMKDFTEAEREYLKNSDEVTRSSFLLRKAVIFIVKHPVRFAQRTMNRIMRYWTYIRPVDTWAAKVSLITYLAVLTLAVAGLVLSGAKGRDVQLVLSFLMLLPATYYFTHIGIFRYRFPIEPILMVFAGYTIYWGARRCRGGIFQTAGH